MKRILKIDDTVLFCAVQDDFLSLEPLAKINLDLNTDQNFNSNSAGNKNDTHWYNNRTSRTLYEENVEFEILVTKCKTCVTNCVGNTCSQVFYLQWTLYTSSPYMNLFSHKHCSLRLCSSWYWAPNSSLHLTITKLGHHYTWPVSAFEIECDFTAHCWLYEPSSNFVD